MSGISGLYTALSGMNAHRRILDVTAHNVSNQSTPGYRRQRVDLAPSGIGTEGAVFAGPASQLKGVDIVGTNRVLDSIAETRAVREQAASSDASTMRDAMNRVESVFPEPSEYGIASQLDQFWSSWGDLANRPDDEVARSAVLGRATSLTETLGRAAADLDGIAATAGERIEQMGHDINDLAARIATLNGSIAASSGAPNDALDARDRLVAQLTQLTGATTRPADGGQVDVYVGGRALISGPITHAVTGTGGTLRWARGGDALTTPPSEAAALRRIIDDVVPQYRSGLDAIAADVVTQVNSLHVSGYDLDGATGREFFDATGTTAATITLSADVAGQPRRLAAGAPVLPGPTAPGPLDGSLAGQLAGLADAPSGPDADYRSFVTKLGLSTRESIRRADTQQMVANRAIDDADSVSGVSIDEEMVNLIQAQRGYEASARVLTAIDQMLGTLIERTGLVGR